MEKLTPEQRCDRVRAALMEAGHPNATVSFGEGEVWVSCAVPEEMRWRAWAVAGEAHICWPCWSTWQLDDCTHDPLTSPWPPLPASDPVTRPEDRPVGQERSEG